MAAQLLRGIFGRENTSHGTATPPESWRWDDLVFSAITAIILAAFAQLVLGSTIGFDDSNITMNYAENLAAGHGYVYYIGGERVEGSTSPLWTAINVVPYMFGLSVEAWLAGTGLVITTLIIQTSIQIAREAVSDINGQQLRLRFAVGGLYFCYPAFFGWTVWSYMDIGLWILLCSLLFLTVIRGISGEGWPLGRLSVLAVALVLSRPEGIAFVVFVAAFCAVKSIFMRDMRGILTLLVPVSSAFVVFLGQMYVREQYFGYPFPNTYYAKVSTNVVDQFGLGLKYSLTYLSTPGYLALFGLTAFLFYLIKRSGHKPLAMYTWTLPFAVAAFGLLFYTTLGGDHFGSFRFFQYLTPLLIACSAAVISTCLIDASNVRAATIAAGVVAAFIFAWSDFRRTQGGFQMSLMIAEHGRSVGNVLETWPEQPSVGVIPAGGIAITYSGQIFDLMGLNWTEMAHADRDAATILKNHGGFSKDVFYRALPQVVDPHFGPCDEPTMRETPVIKAALKEIIEEAKFRELYEFGCRDGLVFYALRKNVGQ